MNKKERSFVFTGMLSMTSNSPSLNSINMEMVRISLEHGSIETDWRFGFVFLV